jgi:hypothetical protein
MKKSLVSLALVGSLGIGGILTYSMVEGEEKVKEESVQSVSASSDDSIKEVVSVKAPTERTVDTNGEVPWNYMSAEQIEASQENGEVVYLFSDAEALEQYSIDLSKNPDTTPYDKDTLATSWANHMTAFLNGVKEDHPDKLDYFMKIEEAKNAMAAFDYDNVPGLIEEAKSLR